jgi:hypothetical protein
MRHVLITTDVLRKLEACEDGIADFVNSHGDKYEVTDYTLERQIDWITGPLKKYWAWCVVNGLLPNLSMRRADLRVANLSGADLDSADLTGADLYHANLRRTDLRRADLRNADLFSANLRGADLRGADLRFADLRYADLRDADLRGANLIKAKTNGVIVLKVSP